MTRDYFWAGLGAGFLAGFGVALLVGLFANGVDGSMSDREFSQIVELSKIEASRGCK